MTAPKQRTIAGKAHRIVVLHVKSRDHFGRPKTVDILYEEDSVNVSSGTEEFLTAFVSEAGITKTS